MSVPSSTEKRSTELTATSEGASISFPNSSKKTRPQSASSMSTLNVSATDPESPPMENASTAATMASTANAVMYLTVLAGFPVAFSLRLNSAVLTEEVLLFVLAAGARFSTLIPSTGVMLSAG